MLNTIESNSSIHTLPVFNFRRWMDRLNEIIVKAVTAFAKFYCSCPESLLHIRHYVDPVTGRAVPMKKSASV